ncbi:hypothetical protein PInf_018542 [Phytophthora infestans]|nr:hypothetical protein PInf_018542 [Phytophthora infestans]
MTTLLIERAKELKELLLLVSKDCLKCYDRIPAWVMELIYLGLGVPDTVRKLMIGLLGPGEIEVRTSFGWIATGEREFGIGQGSILAILHIGVYMDCLQEQREKCVDPVVIRHSQNGHGINIASTMFVDDQLDVTTSYNGLVVPKVDIFIRQVARSVLRLPFNVNTAVFYDKANGLGLESCEADANTYRLVEALRILNSPSLSLIRHAASFDPPLTMAVEWTQPLQTRSSRSNDRPLIDYTPPEQQCSLVAINWKAAFKLRYVGDISNVSGTQIMKLPELMRKGHWSGNDRITLESMNDHWVEVLTRPDTNRLRSPVGCTPVELGSTPFQLRIGVGQWIVVVKMNTNGTEPVIDHYEIGYREIGDVGSHPLGRTIPIDGGMNAPAEVRVIIWDSTRVDGKHGVNNDEVLDEALAKSRMRYLSVIHHGHTLEMSTACSICGRYRNVVVSAGGGTTLNVYVGAVV